MTRTMVVIGSSGQPGCDFLCASPCACFNTPEITTPLHPTVAREKESLVAFPRRHFVKEV